MWSCRELASGFLPSPAELARREIHDATGDRRNRSAHPEFAVTVGRHHDHAWPPDESSLCGGTACLALSGLPIDAPTALDWGLVDEIAG